MASESGDLHEFDRLRDELAAININFYFVSPIVSLGMISEMKLQILTYPLANAESIPTKLSEQIYCVLQKLAA